MEMIADILLISGALAATAYCVILSRRLKKFTDLEKGVGGAIAILSVQVDDMSKTLKVAQSSAAGSAQSLDQLTSKAESVARRLELLVASMHDLPEGLEEIPPKPAETPEPAVAGKQTEIPESQADEQDSGPVFLSQRNRVHEAAE